MEQRNSLYLAILSLLFSVSVLKLTELLQFGNQLKDLIKRGSGLSITVLGSYVFVAGYLIFFIIASITSYGISRQLQRKSDYDQDLGALVGICILVLAVTYLLIFCIVIFSFLG